jgi:predicted fused transcriptional regulator/phosphomethylpyrimidine kinase
MVEHVNAKPTGVMKMIAVVSGLVSVIAHAVLKVDVSDPMLTTVMHVLRMHTVTNMETALATKDGPDVIVQSGSAPVEPVVLLVMAHVMTSVLHVMDGQLCPRMALAL